MLYNSFPFLFLFLPITLIGYHALARFGRLPFYWLIAASLFFYGYWDWSPSHHDPRRWSALWLLIASILFNYACGVTLRASRSGGMLGLGVAVNLATLGYFKYANFFIANANALTGHHWAAIAMALPLGISFFTFTQIAFLVDSYRGETRELNFGRYALFVTCFPHLIAGPIVHHRDLMGQFAEPGVRRWIPANVHAGIVMFTLGLFKKVAIADTVGPWANAVFDSHGAPGFLGAWSGLFAYTFQLYFDFSGYSDMAIGLGLLFNVRLPDNFNAPYRARDIIDFWGRWHITLSRFLRDYLYIPLGGNRKGPVRRYANLMVTMFLGGLWHGAGWTFVLWGVYHGLLLCVAHAWRSSGRRTPILIGRPATFLLVMFGWVLFRSASLVRAGELIGSLVDAGRIEAPAKALMPVGPNQWWVYLLLLAMVNLAPTTCQWLERRPMRRRHAVGLAILFFFCLLLMRDASLSHAPNLFIYFQF